MYKSKKKKKYLFKKTGLFQFTNFLERSIKNWPISRTGIKNWPNSRTTRTGSSAKGITGRKKGEGVERGRG